MISFKLVVSIVVAVVARLGRSPASYSLISCPCTSYDAAYRAIARVLGMCFDIQYSDSCLVDLVAGNLLCSDGESAPIRLEPLWELIFPSIRRLIGPIR